MIATKVTVRSGGQTGVDRAALDAAIAAGLPYMGWCPKGGLAEDFAHPSGLLAVYPLLQETSSSDPSRRTERNVRDSDATLILVANDVAGGSGTDLTRRTAERLGKPCLVVDVRDASALDRTRDWLRALVRGRASFDLNVAGPRESQSPGIYQAARKLLAQALDAICA